MEKKKEGRKCKQFKTDPVFPLPPTFIPIIIVIITVFYMKGPQLLAVKVEKNFPDFFVLLLNRQEKKKVNPEN